MNKLILTGLLASLLSGAMQCLFARPLVDTGPRLVIDGAPQQKPPAGGTVARDIDPCIRSAISQGYVNGQCAYTYIVQCLKAGNETMYHGTLSVEQSPQMLITSSQDNGTGKKDRNFVCPFSPNTYSIRYEAVARKNGLKATPVVPANENIYYSN